MTGQWETFERVGTVIAVRLGEPLEWRTSEGAVMRGEPGDWLVTDPTGERRTVKDASFRATHAPEEGDRWRRTARVRARPAKPGETVETQEGPVVAGDGPTWVVRDLAGAEWLVPDQHFRRAYRRSAINSDASKVSAETIDG